MPCISLDIRSSVSDISGSFEVRQAKDSNLSNSEIPRISIEEKVASVVPLHRDITPLTASHRIGAFLGAARVSAALRRTQ